MPISGEYYLVKLGSVIFTDDGTDSGAACLTKVENLNRLFLAYEGSTFIPLSGLPWTFHRAASYQGIKLVTKPFVIKEDTLDDLKTLIDNATNTNTAIAVVIENGPGAANVDCDPFWENGAPPIVFDEFFEEGSGDVNLYNVQINLITRGLTAP
jgi:hypothetical protein